MASIEKQVAMDREFAELSHSYEAIKKRIAEAPDPPTLSDLQEHQKFFRAVLTIKAKPSHKPKRASKTKSSGASLKKKKAKDPNKPKKQRKPKKKAQATA
jgi:hypothetical protein